MTSSGVISNSHKNSAALLLLLSVGFIFSLLSLLAEIKTEAKQEYESTSMQLDKYQSVASRSTEYEENSQALTILFSKNNILYDAKEVSLAVTTLQKELKVRIQQAGIKLLSIQAKSLKQDNDIAITPINIKLHLRADNKKLAQFIHTLETYKPRGFIESLKIQSQRIKNRNKNSDELDVKLEYNVFLVSKNER